MSIRLTLGMVLRLQQKAQRNLKRINEAYEVLRDYEPPPGGVGRASILSSTFSAIQDLGDIVQTGVIQRPQPRPKDRPRNVVLGMENVKQARSAGRHKGGTRKGKVGVSLTLMVAAVVVIALVLWQIL
jgi:hypothetical protein